ncbi:Ig-like domain-containing protein [Deinococcus sp.]|uniref:Ig-like domain-containing protein n=1 Tax=Deinococcus sp. TaxID=47478 RepID=UPI003B5BE97F
MQRLVNKALGRPLRFALLAATLGAGLSACSGSAPPDTQAPTVSLTASPTTLAAGGTVSLTATASDNVGVRKVEFYDGATKLGEDTAAPYAFSAPATTTGVHPYTARAYDAAGSVGTSAVQNVTVSSSGLALGVWDSSNWDAAEFQ